MKCPYRKIKYTDGAKLIEDFGECYEKDCPFYGKTVLALVKDCGFVCDYEYLEWEDCIDCSAKEYCDRYQDYLRESENTDDNT